MSEKPLTVDDLGKFQKNLIVERPYFFVLANPDQRLIGRCYAWLKRPGDKQDMADLSKLEWDDLHVIMEKWSAAMRGLFHMTHPNYEWLGNEFQLHNGHGHLHMTPRYANPIRFEDEIFVDEYFSDKGGRPHREVPPGAMPFAKRPLSDVSRHYLVRQIAQHF